MKTLSPINTGSASPDRGCRSTEGARRNKFTIVLLGLNHKTAPVELRECLAFSHDETSAAARLLLQEPAVRELVLYSTCNRIEMLMATDNQLKAVAAAKRFISDFHHVALDRFDAALYVNVGDQAVRHLFRVAASLDSMMVGEPQILGQIKEAYFTATRHKTSGVILNRLLHRAFFVAKRVRTETGIGDHAVSISYAAIELGRKIFGSLADKSALLIGAGEMAELAVEHLRRHRAGKILVANRTFENAVNLAQHFGGQAVAFDEIGTCLQDVDIIISSTGSPKPIITREQVKKCIRRRRNRPLFFIDIAVPRDIDPEVNRLTNTYVYDIDDLKGVVEENLEERNREAVKAERIIDEAVLRFHAWFESLEVTPTIIALREKIQTIADAEARRAFRAMPGLGEDGRQAILRMQAAMIKKILHHPTLFLKKNSHRDDRAQLVDTVRKIFGMDDRP